MQSSDINYQLEPITFADNRTFEFMCMLHNGETSVDIKKDSIVEMVIEDTAMNWYSRGYIDIKNPRGALESSIIQLEQQLRNTYMFRNDARDFLSVQLQPNLFSEDQARRSVDDQFYVMKYQYIVYSVKDILVTHDGDNNIKRLYFTDWRHQIFKEYTNTFTTSHYLSGAVAHLSDADREIPTGDAIRHLITETLGEQKFSNNWQSGPYTVHYTSSSNNTSLDDLENLTRLHVSDTSTGNQTCILHVDRYTDTWYMTPLTTLFDYAVSRREVGLSMSYIPGIYQSEQFVIGRDPGFEERDVIDINQKTRVPRTGNVYFNYSYGQSSTVNNYRFVEMHGDMNHSLLNTQPVHQYDTTRKQFNISMSHTNAKSVTKHIQKQIVDNMIVSETKHDNTPLSFNVDMDRYDNKTIEHKYTTDDNYYSIFASTRNPTVMQLLYQSNAIEFTVPGETTRQSNRFISIEHNKKSGTLDTKYNDKVEGQYYVTGVTHQIKNNMYTNKIIGVKPYNYDDQFTKDATTIQHALKTDE